MMTMTTKQNKTLQREQKPLLLHSVLRYLEKNAFSKTLKRFLSEAQIENDNWKASSLDLEDLYWEYLHKCSHDDTNFNTNEEQELRTDGTTRKDRNSNCDASKETIKRENKKRSDESNGNGVADQSAAADNFFTESVAESKVISKEKKKGKRSADSPCQTEHVKSDVFKKPADETAREVQIDESIKKHKDRKKKKSNAESSMSNVELLQGVNEEKSQDLPSSLCNTKADYEADAKPKDKKKKNKRSTNSIAENVEHCGLANKLGMITDNLLSDSALGNTFDIPLEEKKIKSKDKQGKKEGSVSEKLSSGFVEVLDQESPITIDSGNECIQPSEGAVKKDKKSSKKRKRLASDENKYQLVEREAIEESKCRTKSLEEAKNKDQLTKGDGAIESNQNNGQVGQNETHNSSSKYLDKDANENLEKNGVDEFPVQNTTKKQRYGSSEPKTANAFQRVKIDEVVFADEKLQDNSYWAKNGAEVGYGAKAQEILGQVRGRDFRHEKTKKKRGSYRGGQIDLHSHSIKFNYSDED